MFKVILVILAICGIIGACLWPYTINTWGAYTNMDEGEEWNPLTWKGGFLLGICPLVGQFTIPVAIITGVCDLIFIPD